MSSNALLWPSQGTKPEERLDKYKWLRLPSQGIGGEVPIVPAMQYEDLETMVYESLNASWEKRLPLTINPGQVPSTQIDFPLLINDTYPDLIGEVEAELRFAGIDGIQLEYEIQEFDNLTGLLIAWIKKPSLNDGDIIYIYFDNPGAIDSQNPGAVWDVNYKSVYHLNSNGNDSTINTQDLTVTVGQFFPGQIGNAIRFVGTTSRNSKRFPYSGFPSDKITVEAWFKSSQNTMTPFSYVIIGVNSDEVRWNDEDMGVVFIKQVASNTTIDFSDNIFHHIALTWDSVTGTLLLYDNGVLIDTIPGVSTGGLLQDNGSLVLGQTQSSSGGFSSSESYSGLIDEFKISNIVRTQSYFTTTFNNQNNPSAFYATGTVESPPNDSIPMGYEG